MKSEIKIFQRNRIAFPGSSSISVNGKSPIIWDVGCVVNRYSLQRYARTCTPFAIVCDTVGIHALIWSYNHLIAPIVQAEPLFHLNQLRKLIRIPIYKRERVGCQNNVLIRLDHEHIFRDQSRTCVAVLNAPVLQIERQLTAAK